MGKRYYCDYCSKTMSCAPSIIRTHINGLMHQKAKLDHYQKFKDPETILAEEIQKKPCSRFPQGMCLYGSLCRFSHYSKEDLQYLENYVAKKNQAKASTVQPSFEDLYKKLQTNKSSTENAVIIDNNGITHTLPWTYNTSLNSFGNSLPPSVRPITVEDFNNVTISEWG